MRKCLILIFALFWALEGFAQAGPGSPGTVSSTDISAVRTAMSTDPSVKKRGLSASGNASMSLIMERINQDGSFKRTDDAPVPEDLTDTIVRMVYAFTQPDSASFYHQPQVKDKIYRALHYWLDHYPKFKWTTSAMAQPSALGWVLLTLYDDFRSDKSGAAYGEMIQDMQRQSETFIRYSWSNGKENTTLTEPSLGDNPSLDWQRMGNLGYRLPGYTAIIAASDDGASMDTLSLLVANQFSYKINRAGAPAIAAMYDGSLQQHGPQIFNIGYGADWLNDMGSYANWVKESKWRLTETEQSFWADLLLNGMQWMTRDGYAPHNIVGRHTSQKGSLKRDIGGLVNKFLTAADMQLPEYASIVQLRNALRDGTCLTDSAKYFWDADVLLVHSPKYFGSIRMLSDRVVGTESSDPGTGQGINNFYMADGSTFIYRKGTEYDDARAGWNWRCIPGTTVKQKSGPLPFVPWSHGYESDNTICGGVSDGHASICLFDLSRTNAYDRTKACKAYFAFPDMLLCMGNSIRDADTAEGPVYTTVDQTEQRSSVFYSINGGPEQSTARGATADQHFTITAPSWFWQDGMGYILLPSGSVPTDALLITGKRTGNWHDLDKRNPDESISVDMFQLSIDHGSSQTGWKDRSYRYAVIPSVSKEELVRFFKDKVLHKGPGSLSIERNDNEVVSASYDGYVGAVFMSGNSASAPGGLTLSSDKPAVVLMRNIPGGMDIHVSDVTNSFDAGNKVRLTINRSFRPGSFTPQHAEGPWTLERAGAGTILTINLSKTDPIYVGEPVNITATSGE